MITRTQQPGIVAFLWRGPQPSSSSCLDWMTWTGKVTSTARMLFSAFSSTAGKWSFTPILEQGTSWSPHTCLCAKLPSTGCLGCLCFGEGSGESMLKPKKMHGAGYRPFSGDIWWTQTSLRASCSGSCQRCWPGLVFWHSLDLENSPEVSWTAFL